MHLMPCFLVAVSIQHKHHEQFRFLIVEEGGTHISFGARTHHTSKYASTRSFRCGTIRYVRALQLRQKHASSFLFLKRSVGLIFHSGRGGICMEDDAFSALPIRNQTFFRSSGQTTSVVFLFEKVFSMYGFELGTGWSVEPRPCGSFFDCIGY